MAHEVLYGESKAVAQFGAAADEVGKVLAGVREGNGLAHGLLFGDTGAGGGRDNARSATRWGPTSPA